MVSQVVLPKPHYFPALSLQLDIYARISLGICLQFFRPEFGVVGRHIIVLGATMPKATVHEDGDPLLWKAEVWISKLGQVTSPSSYSLRP
jgi:hypothetical protein